MGRHPLSALDRYGHARSTSEVVEVAEFLRPPEKEESAGGGWGMGVKVGGQ